MAVETILSMLTLVCQIKKVGHRVWPALKARLAFAMAAFNICTQWNGLEPDKDGFVHLTMAEFAL